MRILLHDAVYDPRRADNERQSAALAQELLTTVVPEATLRRAVRLIEATERHQVPADAPKTDAADISIFLDMDLSVLAAPQEAFDAYEGRRAPRVRPRVGRGFPARARGRPGGLPGAGSALSVRLGSGSVRDHGKGEPATSLAALGAS